MIFTLFYVLCMFLIILLNTVDSRLLMSNNRLSRSENLAPVATWKFNNRLQSIVEFSTVFFLYISNFSSQITYPFVNCGCSNFFFLNSANLICRDMDISKYVPWTSR